MLPLMLLVVLLGVAVGVVFFRRRPFPAVRVGKQGSFSRERVGGFLTSRGRPGMIILALIGLLALWLVLANLGLLHSGSTVQAGAFVVRVAPLLSTGQDQRQGMIVAEQLVDALKQRVTTPMNVGVLRQPVASAQEALAAAQAEGTDVLVWGQVAEGTTADQAGLRPYLLWLPGEPFVPRTWQGFDGHFALPADYELAIQPLNGSAVLPPLLDSLNHFSRGDADKALPLIDQLSGDYADVLRPELPAVLRAIMLWAQGLLPDAESAAQIAVEATSRPQHWNNLGAVRLDQQKLESARPALEQALAAAPELAQAHANLGRLQLDLGQPAAGLPNLRSATRISPDSPPIVATLGEAYRRSGQLEAARSATTRVLALDPDNGPALAEQSMLALTPALTATGRLEWELELPPARTADQLLELRRQSETAIRQIEALRNEFLQRAAAFGVAGRPMVQRLAETQAAILEQELLNRRYQLMLVQIEQGRVLADRPRSPIRRFWDTVRGRRTPLQEAIATSAAALRQEPNLPLQYDYHYQQGRAAFLSGNTNLARTQFDVALELARTAPATTTLQTRPEAHFGRAQLLIDENKRDEGRAELEAALAADPHFFPARLILAAQADADERWADAEQQYRWLAEHRPWIEHHHLELARMLREQGKTAEAESILLPLANAGNSPAMVMLAALYRSVGQLDEAGVVLQRALVGGGSALVHEEAAELALARNDLQTAEAELQRALALDPQSTNAHIMLGRLYTSRGQPAAAAEQFRAAIQNQSTDPVVHRQLGEALLQIGNPAAATQSFQRAIELAPNSHEAYHGLATAHLAQGRLDAAAEAEQRALELAGGNYTLAIVGQGDIAREQGRYDEAIAHYNTALERDSRLAGAYLGLGKAALAQGRTEIALTHFQTGLAIEPHNIPLLLGIGDARLQQKEIAGAREAYTQAKQLEPNNAAISAALGRALWNEGQTDAALAELSQAIQLNPNDAQTLLTIGEVNAELDRHDAALEAYGRAAEIRDDWYEPRFRRGVLLLELQQTDAAIKDLEAVVRLNRNFAQAHYWLGRAYRAGGQFGAARRQLEQAIGLDSNYFEARFFLGRTLDELGQAPEAVATYEAMLNDAPTDNPWRGEAARELDRIR